jgi:phospholipase/carboxylesterase
MVLARIDVQPQKRGTGRQQTVVLLHGYGADEHDLLQLAHELDPTLRGVSLAAPHQLPWGGRAWFALEQNESGLRWDPAEVRDAADLATASIEQVRTEDGQPPLLLGFSQGACIALLVALRRPGLVRGVLSLSGVPPDRAGVHWTAGPALKGMPVFLAHGSRDPLLPLVTGLRCRALLEEAGCAVSWHEYPIAHQIIGEELVDARAWLAALPPWPPG